MTIKCGVAEAEIWCLVWMRSGCGQEGLRHLMECEVVGGEGGTVVVC